MACPFMELDRHQCKRMLTLDNLEKALSICANDYVNCPVYLDSFKRDNSRALQCIRRTLPAKQICKTA